MTFFSSQIKVVSAQVVHPFQWSAVPLLQYMAFPCMCRIVSGFSILFFWSASEEFFQLLCPRKSPYFALRFYFFERYSWWVWNSSLTVSFNTFKDVATLLHNEKPAIIFTSLFITFPLNSGCFYYKIFSLCHWFWAKLDCRMPWYSFDVSCVWDSLRFLNL